MLEIVTYGAPVLRQAAGIVDRVTAAVRHLTSDMLAVMVAEEGVGIAAPQVGKSLRICVIQHPQLHPRPVTLINPKVVERSEDLTTLEEGCLSVPKLNVPIARARAIRVKYQDAKGKSVEREFVDLMARIVQHEIDHLDGKMIVDHLDLETRLRFEARLRAGKRT